MLQVEMMVLLFLLIQSTNQPTAQIDETGFDFIMIGLIQWWEINEFIMCLLDRKRIHNAMEYKR